MRIVVGWVADFRFPIRFVSVHVGNGCLWIIVGFPRRVVDVTRTAEGSVKHADATSAPSSPARCIPSANTTWLLAGPGKN